jgi:hypothetical protein
LIDYEQSAWPQESDTLWFDRDPSEVDVMDEDTATETFIQRWMASLCSGRTLMVIIEKYREKERDRGLFKDSDNTLPTGWPCPFNKTM